MYVTNIKANTIAMKVGTMYFVTSSIVTSATLQPTNRTEPTGGVTEPIARFRISITPK